MWKTWPWIAIVCVGFTAGLTEAKDPMADALEQGLLPALNCAQKIHLFGGAVKLKQADGRGSRSMDGILESTILEFPSPLSNSTVSLKLSDLVSKTDVSEEGRGRFKKILIPLLLALTITAAIVIPALMTVIKLIAVKGLWSGVVSLIISKLIGLKALLHHHHHGSHSDEGKRPYVIYLPNGKRRREEEENSYQGYQPYQGFQGQDLPWSQFGQDNFNNWRRESGSADNFKQ